MITVFTATYNRGYYIKKLYSSLVNQINKDFEWLIINDGSNDNTEEIVKEFKSEKKINIRYFKQENQGKYKSINKGIDLAKGELFFIVDSDDFLMNDSLSKILLWYKNLKKDCKFKEFIGLAGLKVSPTYELIGDSHNFEYLDATHLEYRYKHKIKGDKAEVFFTEKMRKYKFPIIDENEKFQTEAIVFNKIGQDGQKIRWYNENIYFCEYLEDGLSKNDFKRKSENWNGYIYYYNKIISYDIPFIEKLRELSNYYRFGLNISSLKELFINIDKKNLSLICIPIGYIYYKRDKYYRGK